MEVTLLGLKKHKDIRYKDIKSATMSLSRSQKDALLAAEIVREEMSRLPRPSSGPMCGERPRLEHTRNFEACFGSILNEQSMSR